MPYDDMRPLFTSITDRLLFQTTLADRMWLYPSLIMIPRSLTGLLVMYSVILAFWIPCWLLSHVVTYELGVYLFIIACVVHICQVIGNNQISNSTTLSSDDDLDLESVDVRMIVISPDGSFNFIDDLSIHHDNDSAATPQPQPQPQAFHEGDGKDFCGNDDPQCTRAIV
jgi:hypothetical protein